MFHIRITFTACLLMMASNLYAEFSHEDWQSRVSNENDMDRLGRLYIEFMLEQNPTQSTSLGLHGKQGQPNYYDQRLPEISPARKQKDQAARQFLLNTLEGLDASERSRADQIDLQILKQRVRYHHFQYESLGLNEDAYSWVSSLGEAMSGLVLRDYAPLDDRLKSFGARCDATGLFLDQLKQIQAPTEIKPPETRKTVTLQRLRGMTQPGALYAKALPDLLKKSTLDEESKKSIQTSCDAAVTNIDSFADWFEEQILPREHGNWRLGKDLYDKKYDLYMNYPLDSENLLAVADAWLTFKSDELVSTAREIHDQYLAEEIKMGKLQPSAELSDQQCVQNIFSKISEDRSTPQSLIEDSYAMADSIISFVREQNLMDLPPSSKLRIEDIPPHLAGNAVAQIQTAPPFEPHLQSVWFWDLKLLATAEDFLKEYNRPSLAMVYIHEGVPGHFVQLEYSNRSERVIPRVFWNGPMVEGWASYIATQLVELGFTVYPDHPLGHQLQQMVDDKLTLRTVINAMIDIRLQRTQWSEEEAVRLMTEKGFQEESEARGKLVRAKLTSAQLPSYFAGQLAIENILKEYRAKKGSAFSYKEFNERLVGAGSPPFFAIREYMLND